jgi:hypothetical protein
MASASADSTAARPGSFDAERPGRRGTSPGTLPIEQLSKYELLINLKTAKALGLYVPPSLLALADEVI